MKSIPDYKTILRIKKLYIKKELPESQLNDLLRRKFKERGGMWFGTNLSWYK
jgi:hypothetical protein